MKTDALRYWLGGMVLAAAVCTASAAKSSRPGMGAVPYADAQGTGTTFRVWAGAAKKVEVSGEFNGWGRTALASEGNGIWSVDVPGAGHGQKYKFLLDDIWRKDPRAVRVESSDRDANCYIYDHSLFDWEGAERVVGGTDGYPQIWRNDLVIYEMHVGSFNGESYLPATFDSAIDKIPYLKKLGVSAVEVMPIAEFAGDRSWGYNPGDLFAPESSLGGADGFKRFVRACHKAGIAVIVDVVHNHYGPTDLAIWQFDGKGPNGGMYFYDDDRRYTDWGETRPDYGDTNVVAFIRDQIFSLVEDYHVDGFRWDSVFNIAYHGGYNQNAEGVAMLDAVNTELKDKHPDVFRIAEDNAFDANMNFEAQWHHGSLNDLRAIATTPNDSDRNMGTVASYLCDPYNNGFRQVLYAESHDSCGDLNGKHRLPRAIHGESPQSYWAKKRAFLANAVALVSPGIPMLFMGSEYNEDWDFSNDHSLRWSGPAEENAGIVRMYSDLIALRRNFKGVTGALRETGNAAYTVLNNDGKVVAVARGGGLLLVFNWSATPYQPYETLKFPVRGTWHCLYNSDSSAYDRSFGNVGPAVGDTVTVGDSFIAPVPLGAYSLQVWGTTPLPADAAVAFDPPVPEGCSSVAIAFDPGDGALASADAVSAHIGLNTWDSIRTVPMSRAGGGTLWTCTFDIPDDTSELLVCFHDQSATLWENNNGENWYCAIDGCGGMPSAVTADPARPTDGSTFTLRYEVNAGPLTNRAAGSSVIAHVGINGWNDVRDIPMTNTTGDLWECPVEVPLGTWSLTVCFHDGGSVWDSRDGNNWRIAVAIEDTTPVPSFAVTSPDPAQSPVLVSDGTVAVAGTSTNFPGSLLWTNTANGTAATLRPGAAWTADIPVACGTNTLHFVALNPNDGAADSDYTDTNFRTGGNGGRGFAPWTLDIPSANAGVFTSATDGWGFWANSGAMVEARRPFVYPLQPGDTVTFGFRNGLVQSNDPRGSVGFGFCNAHGQTALEWYFNGGTDDYVLNAAIRTNALPFTRSCQNVAFTLGPDWTYTLAVGTGTWSGNLKNTSVDRIAYVRFWNYTAGHNDDHNLYVSDLAINASNPYLSPELSQNLTVIRPGDPTPVVITPTSATVAVDPDTGAPVLTATLDGDAPAVLADSIWYAVALDPETHTWTWTRLPSTNVTLSGPTVTLRCPDLPAAIYSIGTPPPVP